jgi:hypothetical protein
VADAGNSETEVMPPEKQSDDAVSMAVAGEEEGKCFSLNRVCIGQVKMKKTEYFFFILNLKQGFFSL